MSTADPVQPEAATGSRFRRRPSRLQIVSVGLVTLLSFGPIVALAYVIRSDGDPVDVLATGPPAPSDGARLTATITGATPAAGELRARLIISPHDDLVDESGRPTTDLVLRTNDLRGQNTYEFSSGVPLRPVEIVVALGGSSVERYPFDAYTSRIAAALTSTNPDAEGEAEPVPLVTDVRSSVQDLNVTLDPTTDTGPATLSVVDLGVERRTSTTAYAVWVMVLMWGLAVSGVFIVWAVTIWGAEPPMWSYAYLVGVLFALPQLRSQLPGNPPPGTLLDFVAFYWSIAIVGVSLILTLGIWIRANRPNRDQPQADRHTWNE